MLHMGSIRHKVHLNSNHQDKETMAWLLLTAWWTIAVLMLPLMWLNTWHGFLFSVLGLAGLEHPGQVGWEETLMWKCSSAISYEFWFSCHFKWTNLLISSFWIPAHPHRSTGNLSETFPAPFHVMGVVLQWNRTQLNTVASMKYHFLFFQVTRCENTSKLCTIKHSI